MSDDQNEGKNIGTPLSIRFSSIASITQVFDGRTDCTDWSDECPTSSAAKEGNFLASRYELIGNPFLRAILWIMGIFSTIGNSVGVVRYLKQMSL